MYIPLLIALKFVDSDLATVTSKEAGREITTDSVHQ